MENKVEVVIDGEIITLKSAENEDYMQKLARYIDRKLALAKMNNANASINERIRTVYLAINVADDYFKAQERLDALEAEHEKYILELGHVQEENMLLNEKLHELQAQLNQARRESDGNIVNIQPRAAAGKR